MPDKKRPKTKASTSGATFPQAADPINFEDEHPKFCFRYLQSDFDVKSLPPERQIDLILQLQNLAQLPWKQIKLSNRHAFGTEWIPAAQIKGSPPASFADEARFMMFRYSGKLPMGGLRVRDVFHVFWVEKEFGDLYSHGS